MNSEAVHAALREAAGLRVGTTVCEEVQRVAADDRDREEMRIIRQQMADLAPADPARDGPRC
jgi:hypothetical protein